MCLDLSWPWVPVSFEGTLGSRGFMGEGLVLGLPTYLYEVSSIIFLLGREEIRSESLSSSVF